MWWFTEFNDVTLPLGNFVTNLNLAFAENRTRTTGGEGEYDLDGDNAFLTQQSYSCEFTLPKCDYDTKYSDIKYAARGRGLLKRTNGTVWQRATAKVTAITDTTTPSDVYARTKRMSVTFTAEPYWYNDILTTLSFSGVSVLDAHDPGNDGNARAVKYAVLTITSSVVNPFIFATVPASGGYFYGEVDYGEGLFDGTTTGGTESTFTYTAGTSTTLTIDAGNSTVREGSTDKYEEITLPDTQMALFWLEPGGSTFTFNQAVTGTLEFRSAWR